MAGETRIDSEVVLDLGMTLGEGPRWFTDAQQLHWVDIERRQHWTWRERDETPAVTEHARRVTALAPMGVGALLVQEDRLTVEGADGTHEALHLDDVDPARGRMNDARADARGRLWVGTLSFRPSGEDAALYCVADGQVRRVRDALSLSNGIAFSPASDVMYHADTLNRVVTRTPYDLSHGCLGVPEDFVEFAADLPDGIAVDAHGGVWVALWGGGRVERFDAQGRRTAVVRTPGAELSTAMCLGGVDLRTMYITTATDGQSGHGRHAGAVFRVRVDVPGLPEATASWTENPEDS